MSLSNKSSLRQTARLRREAISNINYAAWSTLCCQNAARWIAERKTTAKIIAGYAPIQSELDVMPLLLQLETGPYVTALPATQPHMKKLVFQRWRSSEALIKGRYGILEPSKDAAIVMPDIVIVPLLAFDRTGHRLGYGGGYYDATLHALRQENPSLLAIGMAFSLQEEPQLHIEAHDVLLDAIITENGIIGF